MSRYTTFGISHITGRKKMSYSEVIDGLRQMTDAQLKYVALVQVGDALYPVEAIEVAAKDDTVLPEGRVYLRASVKEYIQPDTPTKR